MEQETSYSSPFSWRYGSREMREIWGAKATALLWRRLWVALAEVEADYGLVTPGQVAELKEHQDQLDLERTREVEKALQHDLMAELQVFAAQCPLAAGILHLGATSMDIKDNASILQQGQSIKLLLSEIRSVLIRLAGLIEEHAALPLMAFTHLQPAEPSTLGYRLSQFGQDLLAWYGELERFQAEIKAKGFTGAVGSSASFACLLGEKNLAGFQRKMAEKLGLVFYEVTTQTYTRLQDYRLLTMLAGVGAALYKFAFDLRVLQSPGWAELAEPFGESQVGSSAMPFKKNPIRSEKINSLGRYLAQLPQIGWDNAAHSLLERTLDDSANRRTILPEAFLAVEEMVLSCGEILGGLVVNQAAIRHNLEEYGPFAATEKLLMELVKAGADRQQAHEVIRTHSLAAWQDILAGRANPLVDRLAAEQELTRFLSADRIRQDLADTAYLGDTISRARKMAKIIRKKTGS